MKKYTREQLIVAMHQYNIDCLNSKKEESTKDNFTPIDDTYECAKDQVDYLLSIADANS